ncbi:properdin-like isoform 2-T2 [Lycodopsis pacificus]
MQRLRVMKVLRVLVLVLVLVLGSVQRSGCVRCFARFNLTLGQCDEELGEVEEEDCCQNPHYGYQATDGVCRSCGPPAWSPWSPWSPCNVLCGEGVMQRSRKCFGIGVSECEKPEEKLQTKACNATCCDGKGWGLWLTWSSCSVSCGGGGVRSRQRVCSRPECHLACTGPSEETDRCPTHTSCPVHGGWSRWSGWHDCSGSCISDVIVPSRVRHRSCSSPAPSNDTVPSGNSCPGDGFQIKDCSELPNCPGTHQARVRPVSLSSLWSRDSSRTCVFQWTACGQSGLDGVRVDTHSGRRTSSVSRSEEDRPETVCVFIEITTGPSAEGTLCWRVGSAMMSPAVTLGAAGTAGTSGAYVLRPVEENPNAEGREDVNLISATTVLLLVVRGTRRRSLGILVLTAAQHLTGGRNIKHSPASTFPPAPNNQLTDEFNNIITHR